MVIFRAILVIVLISLASACSWVKPKPGAEQVALVKAAHVEGCKSLGKATVAVKDAIVGLDRKKTKVADELLTLAKNQAVVMGGDSLVSLTDPTEGGQTFAVYNCQ